MLLLGVTSAPPAPRVDVVARDEAVRFAASGEAVAAGEAAADRAPGDADCGGELTKPPLVTTVRIKLPERFLSLAPLPLPAVEEEVFGLRIPELDGGGVNGGVDAADPYPLSPPPPPPPPKPLPTPNVVRVSDPNPL